MSHWDKPSCTLMSFDMHNKKALRIALYVRSLAFTRMSSFTIQRKICITMILLYWYIHWAVKDEQFSVTGLFASCLTPAHWTEMRIAILKVSFDPPFVSLRSLQEAGDHGEVQTHLEVLIAVLWFFFVDDCSVHGNLDLIKVRSPVNELYVLAGLTWVVKHESAKNPENQVILRFQLL